MAFNYVQKDELYLKKFRKPPSALHQQLEQQLWRAQKLHYKWAVAMAVRSRLVVVALCVCEFFMFTSPIAPSPLPSPLSVAFLAEHLECSTAGSHYSLCHYSPSFSFSVSVWYFFLLLFVFVFVRIYTRVYFLYTSLLLLWRDFIETFCLCSFSCVYVNIFIY